MDLIAQKRVIFGKKVNALRKQGLIPAELYGKALNNLHLTVSAKEFGKVLKSAGESSVINVVIDSPAGEEKRPALIYAVNHDPTSDAVLSVDLYQVRMDEKLQTKVPVEFTGESPAVKSGGILVKAVQEIEVEALPSNIPQSLIVDLSKLTEIGHSISVKDLLMADLEKKGVRILLEPEMVIATVRAPITEEQEQAAAATTPTLESVKVETEEKKAVRQASADAAKTTEEKSPAS